MIRGPINAVIDGVPTLVTEITEMAGTDRIGTAVTEIESYQINGSTSAPAATSDGTLMIPVGSYRQVPYFSLTDPDALVEPLVAGLNALRVSEINPDWDRYNFFDVADTSSLTVGTHYYPNTNGIDISPIKNLSVTGEVVCPGNCTFDAEVTNDQDLSAANWVPIWSADDHNNQEIPALTCTSTELFALSYDTVRYGRIRWKFITDTAVNSLEAKGFKSVI